MAAGKVAKIRKQLRALRNKPNEGPKGRRKVDLLNELAGVHDRIDPKKTERYAHKALSLAMSLGYKKGISKSYLNIGIAYRSTGSFKQALEYHHKSMNISKELKDREGVAQSCKCIGNIHAYLGDISKTLKYYNKALRIFESMGNDKEIATMQSNIGVTCDHMGKLNQALKHYFKALEAAERIRDIEGLAMYNDNIGVAYGNLGDYEKALRYMLKALAIAEDIEEKECIARSCNNIGAIYRLLGNHKEALRYHRRTLHICEETANRIGIVFSHNNIGIIYEILGDYKQALKSQYESLQIAEAIGFKEGIANSLAQIGGIYLHQGHYQQALEKFQKSLQIFEEIKEKSKAARCNLNIGMTYLKLGNHNSASVFLNEAILRAQETGNKDLVMHGYKHLCQLYEAQKNYDQALQYHKKYRDFENEIYDVQKNKQITEMKTKYETEKKDKEAEIYHLKNVKLTREVKERKKIEKELEKHRDQLEILVRKRTAELEMELAKRKRAEKELLKHQKQLMALTNALALVEEKQRRKTANYLHDNISQSLSLAILKIHSLQQNSSVQSVKEELAEIKDIVAQTNQRTRSLTFEISPPVLYELGLEPALEWLANEFQKQHGIKCSFGDDGSSKPLSDETRIMLFQAVRELLTNVSKHAKAQTTKVTVARRGITIRVIVEDDGTGFNPGKMHPKMMKNEGFGLFNIKERLRHLGGKLEVESDRGHGTVVVLIAPLKRTLRKTRRKKR